MRTMDTRQGCFLDFFENHGYESEELVVFTSAPAMDWQLYVCMAGYLIFLTSVRTVVIYTRNRVFDFAENRE